MKLVAVAALMLASMVGAQQVQHAPTVEQCRADQALWDDQINQPASDWAHSVPDISARSLYAMFKHMDECQVVDPDQVRKYSQTSHLILIVLGSDFMIRHSLEDKFFEEDDAGAR